MRPSSGAAGWSAGRPAEIPVAPMRADVAATGDAALYPNREDLFPCRRGATALECGALSCSLYGSSNHILPATAGERGVALACRRMPKQTPAFSALLPISAVFSVGCQATVRPRRAGRRIRTPQRWEATQRDAGGGPAKKWGGRNGACLTSLHVLAGAGVPCDDRGEAAAIRIKSRTCPRFGAGDWSRSNFRAAPVTRARRRWRELCSGSSARPRGAGAPPAGRGRRWICR